MTTKPELDLGSHLAPGIAALALFLVMTATFVTAQFPAPEGFPGDASITASIGYAMFNLDFGAVPSESFLIAFEIIDLVLVAALAGAVLLARRESEGEGEGEGKGASVSLLADGGRELKRTVLGDRTDADTDVDADADAGGDR